MAFLRKKRSDTNQQENQEISKLKQELSKYKGISEECRIKGALYLNLVKACPDAITIIDKNMKVLVASEKTAKLHGFDKAEDLVGKKALDLIAEEDIPIVQKNVFKTVKDNRIGPLEYKFKRKDGTTFLGEINSTVIKDAKGKPEAFITIFRDITSKKETERNLKASEKKYRQLVSNAAVGIFKSRVDGKILYVNQAFVKMMGFSSAEEMKQISAVKAYADPSQRTYILKELTKKGRITEVEAVLLSKDGQPKDCLMSAFLDGDVISGMFMDITMRKKAENMLKDTVKKKELILSSISEHVIFYNKDSRVVWSNKAAADYLSKKPEDTVGMNCCQLWGLRDEDCKVCPVDDVLATGDKLEKEMGFTKEKFWFVRIYPVKGENGDIAGAVEVTSDITVRKKIENILSDSEKKFRNLSQEIPIGVAIVIDRKYYWINRAFKEIFEYSEEDILNKEYDFLIAPEERDILIKRIEAILSGRAIFPKHDIVGITKTKKKVYIEVQARKVEFDGKEAIQIVAQDVTQRNLAERLLKRERDITHLYFDLAAVIMLVLNPEGRVVRINRRGCELLGYVEEEILGKDWFEGFLPERCRDSVKEVFRNLKKGDIKIAEYAENPILIKTGEERLIKWHNSIINDDNGNINSILSSGEDITKSQQMQKKLQQSEKKYRDIVEDQQELVCRYFSTGVLTFVNNAYCNYFGKNKDQLINRNFLAFIHEDDRELVQEKINSLSKDNTVCTIEERVEDKEGRTRWLRWINRAILDEGGELYEIQAVGRDITEARQAQDKVEASERNYRTIFNSVNDALFVHEIETGKIIDVNSKVLDMYGFSDKGELIGSSVEGFGSGEHPYTPNQASLWIKKAASGQPQVFEWHTRKKTGELFWAEINLRKVTLLGHDRILAVVRDITSRKKKEIELRENEKNYRLIFERANDGIVILDKQMRIKKINPKVTEVLGYDSVNEIIGKDVSELIAPEQKDLIMERARKRMAGEDVPSRYEGRFLKKDGSLAFIEVNAAVTEFYGEKVDFVIARDITQRKNAEAERIKMQENYQAIFNSANDTILVLDEDTGKVLEANKKLCEMFGYAEEEIGTLSIEQLSAGIAPYTQEYAIQWIKRAASGKPQLFEWKVKNKNKDIFWVEINIKRIVLNKEYRLLAILRDISRRKSSEDKLAELNTELLKYNKEMERLSLIDAHTGLYNYRYFEKVISAEFDRARRCVNPLSLIMLDIDYFKSINDVYGNRFGDLVLKQFSEQLQKMVRRYDYVIRYGGEEFMIISPGASKNIALKMSRRINEAFGLYHFGDEEHRVTVSLSIGVASYPEDRIFSSKGLVDLLGKILHAAKEDGGNRAYTSKEIKNHTIPKNEKEAMIDHNSIEGKIRKITVQANRHLVESVLAFAKTIELKDEYTGEHVEKTVQYATEIAWALNLPRDDVERVRQAAILHDLGKVGISETLLHKKDKLTAEEFEKIKSHPQIAADILRPIQFLHDVIPLIFYHHERWDGKGYPCNLKGEAIPIGARIIAVADVYQALISDRPYRKRYPQSRAIKIIKEGSDRQFDPTVVKAFLTVVKRCEE